MSGALRILVVRFSSLGDVLLISPLLRAARTAFPDADITVTTHQRYAEVFHGNPRINRVVPLRPGESVRGLAARLGPGPFDHALDLHGSLRSGALRRLLPGRWTVYDKERGSRLRLLWLGGHDVEPRIPTAERYFTAARPMGLTPDGDPAEVFPSDQARATARGLVPEGAIALAPGARHRTKRWPAPHWGRLADDLAARGLPLVGIGSAAERALLDHPRVIDGFGQPIMVTAALLERARLLVCNDSGLMHLATAVRRPVVALFGPTVRAFGFAPYRTPSIVLERALGCRPCSATGGAFCPLLHHRCLAGIPPAEVAATVLAAA